MSLTSEEQDLCEEFEKLDMAQSLSEQQAAELQERLQDAVVACTERCLYHSAKWASELLNSFPETQIEEKVDLDVDSQMTEDATQPSPQINRTAALSPAEQREAELEAKEKHKYLLALNLFQCREYDRCAAVFLPTNLPSGFPTSPSQTKAKPASKGKGKATNQRSSTAPKSMFPELSQKSLFLALYARYTSGEKTKDEESEMILGPADGGVTTNKELIGITQVLDDWFARHPDPNDSQGWLEYLFGIVLAKGSNDSHAKEMLIRSVHRYQYNWCAWLELASLIENAKELNAIAARLPQSLMTYIFHVYTCQELYIANEQIHAELDRIQAYFPRSSFLKTQRALLYYHTKDFTEAEEIFSSLLKDDPSRLDSLDQYSNILFVMEKGPKLAFLAQAATHTDKFRPETCCVVGNYYSLKSEHEKAVMYFRRALTLDRNFLSAWTLMGHEYTEMKNTHAAIESYRRAVDINRKDYRAWYGLGQTYELLEMYAYALHYYQRAAALRAHDPKMWQALGSCYARTGRIEAAIKAYKRALAVGGAYENGISPGGEFGTEINMDASRGPLDPEVLYAIALLYERTGQREEAAGWMQYVLEQEYGGDAGSSGAGGGGGGGVGSSQETEGTTVEDGRTASNSGGGAGHGVGVTATTSNARMWLARWWFSQGTELGYEKAMGLANELCQDGHEVEDAKALIRDIRARMEKERKEKGGPSKADERKFGRDMVA
ncbi:MAG: Anaphase-promoting complex subunit 23 [Bogoriella megaspora]|nr:MAG: Anaphase-promoting complex subunit 23 [Bogoriella megaspora]